jgi:secreted PhoX family phosphatase
MPKLSRRQLLVFFGGGVGAAVLASIVGRKIVDRVVEPLKFTPVRLPHPLPIYQQQESFLARIDQAEILGPSADTKLASYTVLDDVVVPPEYERYVIVRWGDRVFPDRAEYFGYNNDYTAFIPIDAENPHDGYLWVNHESISFPFSPLVPDAPEDVRATPATYPLVIGQDLPGALNIEVLGEFLYNLGGSVVRVSQDNQSGRFAVQGDRNNRRIHGLSGLGINRQRADQYRKVTAWGSRSYQKGDNNYLISTGPAATQVFNLSTDGLRDRIIGTAYNCSGGTTPWGTVLSAEENFQGGVTEAVKPDGTQTEYTQETVGATFGLVGEKYGWIVELEPANPKFRPRKHTSLGRFRHENVAIRVESRQKLVAYMGDDRRGGHTWKFVSKGTVTSPSDQKSSRLLEDGTLYVARYNPDGTGTWIPLLLETHTNPISPSVLAAAEIKALGTASENGGLSLPSRSGITDQAQDGGPLIVNIKNETQVLPQYQNKQLSNFYSSQGAILCDAFLAANLAGGTPTARPEDVEVHPRTKEVFIAYTDGAPDSDGYPDSRIFVVAKYRDAVNDTQPSGGLYKIIEDSPGGTGLTFHWERFAQGGEAGAEAGAGFANVDNLAFDSQGNVWGVTDMSTSTHNGFDVGAAGALNDIDHTETGKSKLTGVFGNNWLLFIPTSGPNAGEVMPFAYGPIRCEMTGPTFVGDTLILSVQHPGEDCPINDGTILNRNIEMLDLNGSLFKQTRSVPRGSSWPSNIEGNPQGPPRPSVIGIRRKQPSGRFV